MRDIGKVGMRYGEESDAAEQRLLSITSASSRVISKQTDWNRPTEASPGGVRDGQKKSGKHKGRGKTRQEQTMKRIQL